MRVAFFALFALACQVYDSSLLVSDGGEAGADACLDTCKGQCVNTQTDKNNCGGCGTVCETGCTNGYCQPTVLVTGLGAPHGVLVEGASLYVANHGGINVQVMSTLDGTGLKNLASSQVFPDRLASDGTNLYWSNDSDPVGSINFIAKTGTQSFVAINDMPLPYGLAYDSGNLYFTTLDTTNKSSGCAANAWTSSVFRCPTSTYCFMTDCVSGGPVPLATAQAQPSGIAVDGTNIYWANAGGHEVMFCPKPDCAGGPKVFASGVGTPFEVFATGTLVFFTDRTGSLFACAASGCNGTPTPLATGLSDPVLVFVDASGVYVTEYAAGAVGKGKIARCSLPTCAGGPLTLAVGLNAPYGIATDASYVYWSEEGTAGGNSTDGRVAKLKKP